MATVSTTEARKKLADILNRARYAGEATTITRQGEPVAAVVSVEDLEAMQALEDLMDVQAADEALREHREQGGSVTVDELRRELGL